MPPIFYNTSVIRLLLARLLRMLFTLLGVILVVFVLVRAIPGNPWNNYSANTPALVGIGPDASTLRQLERRFGLDLPLWRQYTRYIIGDFDRQGTFFCGAVCGNLGPSFQQRGRSVQDILFAPPEGRTSWHSRFGYSIRLVLLAALIAAGLGLPLGILGALYPRSPAGRAVSVGLAGLVSVPNFIIGLLAMIVLGSWLKLTHILPDWDTPTDWIVPAIVLAVIPFTSLARLTQAAFGEILAQDFIRAARARGVGRVRLVLRHTLRPALVPILTFLGPALVEMFTGLLVVENLFAFPGFGQEYWRAVLNLDYTLILGLTAVYAAGILLTNLLVEALCQALDPRLRLAHRMEAQ